MYKKIISIFIIYFIIINSIIFYAPFANSLDISCSYSGKYNRCVSANKSGDARGITDFVCIETTNDVEILLQVILDEEFKKIDDDIESYLETLETDKEYSLEKLDEVVEKFYKYGEYRNKYEDLCKKGILEKYFTCVDSAGLDEVRNFLGGENDGSCIQLVGKKIDAYRYVAYDILKLSKLHVRKETRKKYNKEQRDKYSEVLSIMGTIVGYINRIWKGWATKTNRPYSCD